MTGDDRQYIRRLLKNAVKRDRTILPRAFSASPNDSSISFTLRGDVLQSEDQLRRYRKHKRLNSGDLPGLCYLTHQNLTQDLKPPLPPRYQEDSEDTIYGTLHHETDVPDETQQNDLATKATQHGLLLPFVHHTKGDWPP
jgi:hypothetical protein